MPNVMNAKADTIKLLKSRFLAKSMQSIDIFIVRSRLGLLSAWNPAARLPIVSKQRPELIVACTIAVMD